MGTPIVQVPKSNGTVRICKDYKQTINQVAQCNNYPIPVTDDLLVSMAGGERFTKLDLSHAYQQLQLAENTQEYLTISTHRGVFHPCWLQFRVHSATEIFQREMDQRLRNVPSTLVRVDNILISAKDDNEHLKNLATVLGIIENTGLRLKKSKCKFLANEVTYLGYCISKNGFKPLAEKVSVIKDVDPPKNVTELKAFLGILNYYNHYLPKLSTVIEPFHRLLKKGIKFHWGPDLNNAFSAAKSLLRSAPVLTHFDPSLPIVVYCDASPYGVETVLTHIFHDNSKKPVCYISRTLSPAKKIMLILKKKG